MIEWNKVIYDDCMNPLNGLPTIPDDSIDLCITDPPWNVEYGAKNIKFNYKFRTRKDLEVKGTPYSDKKENYYDWCLTWFNELIRITKGIVIYSGMKNIKFWISQDNYKGMAIHYVSNAKSNGFISYRTCLKPVIFFGKTNRLGNDFFNYYEKWGFLNKKRFEHPCPTNEDFWTSIISQLKPKSIIDPFMGSGTTAEVCTRLGIKWIGYEKNMIYSLDIKKRLENCILEPKQVSLLNYVRENTLSGTKNRGDHIG